MDIKEIIQEAGENAKRHDWRIFWDKPNKQIYVGEAIALMHEELSEALRAYRENDKEHFTEELADVVIRIGHMAAELDFDLDKAIQIKMQINRNRPKNHGKINL
jgi:NTP pyrophosphatase (non-canonical NTP hydrolase)